MASSLDSVPGFAPSNHCLKLPEREMEACTAEVRARNHDDGNCVVGTTIGVIGGAAVSIGFTPWIGVPAGVAITAMYCKDTAKRVLNAPTAQGGVTLRAPQNIAPRAPQAAIPASAAVGAPQAAAPRKL